ncbi:MAG: hypothetical protein U0457_15855 [Candidatus Sericytochromatia bacterium]
MDFKVSQLLRSNNSSFIEASKAPKKESYSVVSDLIRSSSLNTSDSLSGTFLQKKSNIATNIFENTSLINLETNNNLNTRFNNNTLPLINENTRVLHIGDSHTVGIYGHTLDNLLRKTGAKVESLGSAGSAPSAWVDGYTNSNGKKVADFVTHSGFFKKDEQNIDTSPKDWKTPTATPKANNLISEFKPNVIIFSLGANLIHANEKEIEKQVKDLCEVAKSSGAKIIWVGPPNGRSDKKPKAEQDRLYEHIQKIASQYGTFIDSRAITEYPDNMKGDGVHFWGEKGSKIAKNWANTVFDEIQNSN